MAPGPFAPFQRGSPLPFPLQIMDTLHLASPEYAVCAHAVPPAAGADPPIESVVVLVSLIAPLVAHLADPAATLLVPTPAPLLAPDLACSPLGLCPAPPPALVTATGPPSATTIFLHVSRMGVIDIAVPLAPYGARVTGKPVLSLASETADLMALCRNLDAVVRTGIPHQVCVHVTFPLDDPCSKNLPAEAVIWTITPSPYAESEEDRTDLNYPGTGGRALAIRLDPCPPVAQAAVMTYLDSPRPGFHLPLFDEVPSYASSACGLESETLSAPDTLALPSPSIPLPGRARVSDPKPSLPPIWSVEGLLISTAVALQRWLRPGLACTTSTSSPRLASTNTSSRGTPRTRTATASTTATASPSVSVRSRKGTASTASSSAGSKRTAVQRRSAMPMGTWHPLVAPLVHLAAAYVSLRGYVAEYLRFLADHVHGLARTERVGRWPAAVCRGAERVIDGLVTVVAGPRPVMVENVVVLPHAAV
ncbi:hypothetical protein GGF31_001775 [Allomyces arbusculus]|nr:hypothetical protein GGF31_001775 [Allomyces arbusculus]